LPSEKPLRCLEDILENIARIEQFTAGVKFGEAMVFNLQY